MKARHSKRREMESLEFWAVSVWSGAAMSDGIRTGNFSQYSEWRAAKKWFWGFAAAARDEEVKRCADFLAEIASLRGLQ